MKTTSKRKKKSLYLKGWETLDYCLLFVYVIYSNNDSDSDLLYTRC